MIAMPSQTPPRTRRRQFYGKKSKNNDMEIAATTHGSKWVLNIRWPLTSALAYPGGARSLIKRTKRTSMRVECDSSAIEISDLPRMHWLKTYHLGHFILHYMSPSHEDTHVCTRG